MVTGDRRHQVLLRFETADDLVMAYSGPLGGGALSLRTEKALPVDAPVSVRILVASSGASLELGGTVREADGVPDQQGRYRTHVELSDVAGALETFIVAESDIQPDVEQEGRRSLLVIAVDDSPAQLAAVAEPLRKRGDVVHTATNGLEGLALAMRHAPDIILSDVQMPKMDGWQLLRIVRSRASLRRVPFLLLTTLSGEQDRLKGYRLGVSDYLGKPVGSELLLERVDRAVQHFRVGAHSWAPEAKDALRGDLEQVSLPAVLSLLQLESKTGTVRLGNRETCIVVHSGKPVRARTPELDSRQCGQEALLELLNMRAGPFEFLAGEVDPADSIGVPIQQLLMEHARRVDEQALGFAG